MKSPDLVSVLASEVFKLSHALSDHKGTLLQGDGPAFLHTQVSVLDTRYLPVGIVRPRVQSLYTEPPSCEALTRYRYSSIEIRSRKVKIFPMEAHGWLADREQLVHRDRTPITCEGLKPTVMSTVLVSPEHHDGVISPAVSGTGR